MLYFSLQFLYIYAAEILLDKIQNTKIMLSSIKKIPKDIRLYKSVRKYVNNSREKILMFIFYRLKNFHCNLHSTTLKSKPGTEYLSLITTACLMQVSMLLCFIYDINTIL